MNRKMKKTPFSSLGRSISKVSTGPRDSLQFRAQSENVYGLANSKQIECACACVSVYLYVLPD